MTSDTPEISVEDRSEKRRLVAAYVQQRLITECEVRGGASRIAKATGFSTAHVANAKNHGTVGADFAEAMAAFKPKGPEWTEQERADYERCAERICGLALSESQIRLSPARR